MNLNSVDLVVLDLNPRLEPDRSVPLIPNDVYRLHIIVAPKYTLHISEAILTMI